MPKRILDFEAMWASGKLSKCKPQNRSEYSWLYGLADVNGSFEMTNMTVIFGKVAPIRPDLTVARLEEIFNDFHRNDLLYKWQDEASGKVFGHWIGSEKGGRLPPKSQREKYATSAPPVPKEKTKRALPPITESRLNLEPVQSESRPESRQEGFGLGLDSDRKGKVNTTSRNAQNQRVPSLSLVSDLARKKQLTPQQIEYGKVHTLANEALRLIGKQERETGKVDEFALKEDLKQWCASCGIPYNADEIRRALDAASGKAKSA
jgi:hypothetical protein